jgi:hypothetical protein
LIRYLTLALLLALPLGCSKSAPAPDPAPTAKGEANAPAAAPSGNHARLQGTWTLDFDETVELDPKMKELVAGDPATGAQLRAGLEKTVFTVGPSEISSTPSDDGSKVGYTVTEDTGDTLEVTMEEPGRPASQGVFTFADDDHVTMQQGPGPAIALKRKTP